MVFFYFLPKLALLCLDYYLCVVDSATKVSPTFHVDITFPGEVGGSMLGEAGRPQGSSNETLLQQQTDPNSAVLVRKTGSTDACQEGGICKKVHSRRKKGEKAMFSSILVLDSTKQC